MYFSSFLSFSTDFLLRRRKSPWFLFAMPCRITYQNYIRVLLDNYKRRPCLDSTRNPLNGNLWRGYGWFVRSGKYFINVCAVLSVCISFYNFQQAAPCDNSDKMFVPILVYVYRVPCTVLYLETKYAHYHHHVILFELNESIYGVNSEF